MRFRAGRRQYPDRPQPENRAGHGKTETPVACRSGGRYSFSLICSLSRPIAIRTITNDQANDPIMARVALSGCL